MIARVDSVSNAAAEVMVGRARRRGLTLLEVLLSLALIVMMMSMVFGFYMTVLRVRDEGSQLGQDVQLTRAILERMAEEIRHATDIVPGDGIGFQGTEEKITIVRTRLPENYAYLEFDDTVVSSLPPLQLDLIRVSYELLRDEELVDDEGVPLVHGLWRSEQKRFDPSPDIVVAEDAQSMVERGDEALPVDIPMPEGELYAPEIKYLRFQYFDGSEWRDQWQTSGETGGLDLGKAAASGKVTYALPQAVMITVGRVREDPREKELKKQGSEEEEEDETYHPDRFTVVVHVLQSDPSLITSRKYGVADQLGRQEGL